jgi:hypothetical protein
VSNVLIALAYLATGDQPLVGREFAQRCSSQLLSLVSTPFSKWVPQSITNTVWAATELGLPAAAFLSEAVQAARVWVPVASDIGLNQVAQACAMLQHRDEGFLSLVLQRASVLLQQQQQGTARSGSRVLSAAARANLAAILPASVANLDMPRQGQQGTW